MCQPTYSAVRRHVAGGSGVALSLSMPCRVDLPVRKNLITGRPKQMPHIPLGVVFAASMPAGLRMYSVNEGFIAMEAQMFGRVDREQSLPSEMRGGPLSATRYPHHYELVPDGFARFLVFPVVTGPDSRPNFSGSASFTISSWIWGQHFEFSQIFTGPA